MMAFKQHYRRFRGHEITVERGSKDENWYIQVFSPSGGYAYDGWWRDSASKTVAEAFAEAKRGACLILAPGLKEKGGHE